MANIKEYELAMADVAEALKLAERAWQRLNKAAPLGQTAKHLNPRGRLLEGVGRACSVLRPCADDYNEMLEAVFTDSKQ